MSFFTSCAESARVQARMHSKRLEGSKRGHCLYAVRNRTWGTFRISADEQHTALGVKARYGAFWSHLQGDRRCPSSPGPVLGSSRTSATFHRCPVSVLPVFSVGQSDFLLLGSHCLLARAGDHKGLR